MRTIIFDTETTGLIKPSANDISAQPYIIEIFCLEVIEGHNSIMSGDSFGTLIKPPIPLPEEIVRITGINQGMVDGAPEFIQIWEDLARFFTGADRMVAHNLPFDRAMLANELLRTDKLLNFPWPVEHVCTVEKTLHIEQRRMNMQKMHEHFFGRGFEDAHRAKNDVMRLFDCYKFMREKEMI